MPTDWHTRDKVLSSETAASKNLDPLINRSHTLSFFTPIAPSQFVKRSSKSDSVAFQKKLQWAAIIWCVFTDKARKSKR